MKKIFFGLFCLLFTTTQAQNYTSFFTGNTTNVDVTPTYGVCLMGGATENDNAMRWFLERANGGDVLVLRASGSDGYNNYFFSELGVTVNSVETIVVNNAAGAIDGYVLDKIENAEAIWFAGGDQWNYVNYFRNTEVEDLLNAHIIEKEGVIGGTSAGMAILGGHYFSAQNGTVTSAQALNNPYDDSVALGGGDFINIPLLENSITDTHFDNPDRKGRLTAFLARIATDDSKRSFGIASEEFTAVCIDASGEARVFGGFPQFQDFAYFLQANCTDDYLPEDCSAGDPLLWDREGEAVKVFKVAGTQDGAHTFNIASWASGSGGDWENWTAQGGNVQVSATTNPNCDLLDVDESAFAKALSIYPNPAKYFLKIDVLHPLFYTIWDSRGKQITSGTYSPQESIDVSSLSNGIYFVGLSTNTTSKIVQFVKE